MGLNLVMIIDDDSDDRIFFEDALRKINENISCIHAQHGEEALVLLKDLKQFPEFIFLDLNMPVMNGVEFLRSINSNKSLQKIPVIIYTTSVSEDDMKITSELGAKYYLPKSAELDKLPAKIAFSIDMVKRLAHKNKNVIDSEM